MDPQLETLLEIQDLKSQREELSREETLRKMESDLFEVQVEEALERLDDKIDELEGRLADPVRRRYRGLADKGLRAVVPVLKGVCYGCFMAVPTAWSSEQERHEQLDICENCGRFLYHLD